MTQCERIVRHMEDYGSITSLEAMTEYGIMRLASRIADLKDLGYPIVSERECSKNRHGRARVLQPIQTGELNNEEVLCQVLL